MSLSTPSKGGARSYRQWHRRLFELVLFALLADVMFVSKILMEALPNIHLLAMLIAVFTVTFRVKALIPIYLYVFLDGLVHGFPTWWVPYLYIWTILWGMVMLLPRRMPRGLAPFVYATVCGLHGFLFGILYAPAEAWLFGLNFEDMLLWLAAGIPYDVTHGISDFLVSLLLTMPLSAMLGRLTKKL